uniref:Uncharacterized protein n=1 Tax=Arundo donax TaxID=35708 RepID=A0A0A8XTK9_ARUDO
MLMSAKATCEVVQGAASDHLGGKELLFSCSSGHLQTFVCKGCCQWFPSPQMQECQVAPSAESARWNRARPVQRIEVLAGIDQSLPKKITKPQKCQICPQGSTKSYFFLRRELA